MIEFPCPFCGKWHKAKEAAGGKSAKCSCGKKVDIPLFSIPREAVSAGGSDWTPLAIGLAVAAGIACLAVLFFAWKRYGVYKRECADIEARNLITDGDNARKAGKKAEALEAYQKAIEMRPEWIESYLPAAECAMAGSPDVAKDLFRKVLKMDPGKKALGSIYAHLGYLALKQKKPDLKKAASYLEKALKADKNALPCRVMLAAIQAARGDSDDAFKTAAGLGEKEKEVTGEGQSILKVLAMRSAFAESDDQALLASRKRPGSNPEWLDDEFLRMALCLFFEKKSVDFEKDKELLAAIQSSVKPVTPKGGDGGEPAEEDPEAAAKQLKMQLRMADLYVESKSWDKAMEYLNALRATAPESARVQELLAVVLGARFAEAPEAEKTGLGKELLAQYRTLLAGKALDSKARESIYLSALGLSDFLKDEEYAKTLLTQGLNEFSRNATLLVRAGRLEFQEKNYKGGIALLERARDAGSSDEQLLKEIELYRGKPVFDDLRPSKARDYSRRPLLHARVKSGSPLPIEYETVRMRLDGEPIEFARGGNELFYVPPKDLDFGMHKLELKAQDSIGNVGYHTFEFPVDGSPPSARRAGDDGVVRMANPVVAIELFDSMTAVDLDTVSLAAKSTKGSGKFLSLTVVTSGKYARADEELGYAKGDPLKTNIVRFRLGDKTMPGRYEVHVRLTDVMGNKGTAKVPFVFGR